MVFWSTNSDDEEATSRQVEQTLPIITNLPLIYFNGRLAKKVNATGLRYMHGEKKTILPALQRCEIPQSLTLSGSIILPHRKYGTNYLPFIKCDCIQFIFYRIPLFSLPVELVASVELVVFGEGAVAPP